MTPEEILSQYDVHVFTRPPLANGTRSGGIAKVTLPFTNNEWCHLCMRDGELYFGGCCGPLGYAQDTLNGIFRNTGTCEANELRELAEIFLQHDGARSLFHPKPDEVLPTKEAFFELLPLDRLALIWRVVKDHLVKDAPQPLRRPEDKLRHAVRAAKNGLYFLDMHYLFQGFGSNTPNPRVDMAMAVNLSRLIPALKVLQERFVELDPGTFEGVAIFDESNEITSNNLGLCIFRTQEEAEEELKGVGEAYEGTFHTRKVRITLDGVEILNDLPPSEIAR